MIVLSSILFPILMWRHGNAMMSWSSTQNPSGRALSSNHPLIRNFPRGGLAKSRFLWSSKSRGYFIYIFLSVSDGAQVFDGQIRDSTNWYGWSSASWWCWHATEQQKPHVVYNLQSAWETVKWVSFYMHPFPTQWFQGGHLDWTYNLVDKHHLYRMTLNKKSLLRPLMTKMWRK